MRFGGGGEGEVEVEVDDELKYYTTHRSRGDWILERLGCNSNSKE
jgi:hypothetical protein